MDHDSCLVSISNHNCLFQTLSFGFSVSTSVFVKIGIQQQTIDKLLIIVSCFPKKIMKPDNNSAIKLDNIMLSPSCFLSATELHRRRSCDRGSSHAGLLGYPKSTELRSSKRNMYSKKDKWFFICSDLLNVFR